MIKQWCLQRPVMIKSSQSPLIQIQPFDNGGWVSDLSIISGDSSTIVTGALLSLTQLAAPFAIKLMITNTSWWQIPIHQHPKLQSHVCWECALIHPYIIYSAPTHADMAPSCPVMQHNGCRLSEPYKSHENECSQSADPFRRLWMHKRTDSMCFVNNSL